MSFLRNWIPNRGKICGTIAVLLTAGMPTQASAGPVAIIGGQDQIVFSGYGALISSSGEISPLALSGDITTSGNINSVSINSSGNSIIGGQAIVSAYGALISSSGGINPLVFTDGIALHGFINAVAINSFGNSIIGGKDTFGPVYAALVSPSGEITPLTFPGLISLGGTINSVSINDFGNSLIGGVVQGGSQSGYAALVSTSGAITPLTLTGGITMNGNISSVSINFFGNGLIGGQYQSGPNPIAYAALVSTSGAVTPLDLGSDLATQGVITSVAINNAGNGIVGGQDQSGVQPTGYAALVSTSGQVIPLTLTGGVTTNGIINSVAINDAGNGVIGGQDLNGSQPAYAALVSSSGAVTPLLSDDESVFAGVINSVAINSDGNGIIGGQNQLGMQPAYAALFLSDGTVIPLTFTGDMATSGVIHSVSMINRLSTASLSGNNLIFANYINEFAVQNAFYFIPAALDGTLNAALESAAPTRNAVSIYTADYNLFGLTTNFANHIRNQQMGRLLPHTQSYAAQANGLPSEELLASLSLQKRTTWNCPLDTPDSIWFEAIGALAYQKKQQETVGFNPTTGGAILAYDRMITEQFRLGGGVSYLFTHIHEKEGQGHSNINQEDAFIYGSWDNQRFYADLLLLGGAVQIDQVRNTIMTGFTFRSSSHPKGWQLLPHLELGFKKSAVNQCETFQLCPNPFVMVDWANGWQGSYEEHGDSPFNAGQTSQYGSLLRIEAGFRFYETFFFEAGDFSLQEKISYVNTQTFSVGRVHAFLVGSPGSFTVETLTSPQNLGVAQLAMTFDPLHVVYPISTLFYQGEFGSHYQSHQLSIDLTWQF